MCPTKTVEEANNASLYTLHTRLIKSVFYKLDLHGLRYQKENIKCKNNIQGGEKIDDALKQKIYGRTMKWNLYLREKYMSLITIINLDPYKFLNRLTTYGAFVWLKPQLFGTFTAHTLDDKEN